MELHRLGLDIRRYFPSVDHEILLALLSRRIRDRRTVGLLRVLIGHGGGVYQTRLARELDGLDHFTKRELKVPAYLRYMDDLTLFADQRGQLETAREAIETWLWTQRRLQVHLGVHVVPAREPSTYLGVRVSSSGLAPGEKVRRRLRAKVREAAGRGPRALARSLQAYLGVLRLAPNDVASDKIVARDDI